MFPCSLDDSTGFYQHVQTSMQHRHDRELSILYRCCQSMFCTMILCYSWCSIILMQSSFDDCTVEKSVFWSNMLHLNNANDSEDLDTAAATRWCVRNGTYYLSRRGNILWVALSTVSLPAHGMVSSKIDQRKNGAFDIGFILYLIDCLNSGSRMGSQIAPE